ncbi:DUF3540 domain-containing protein [Burkholderia sp. WSM2232]|uniref:DUF3540 domain-containing protein n=1 Tax=Burkholderia sp. WSM2232 TaxID=944436 RepID=UPI000408D4C7|nr:DUF3540 domain-containing protein [Burkholderia sp. WSM2232]
MKVAHSYNGEESRFYHGRVIATDGQRFAVACDAGSSWAAVAAGCLMQPQLGDTVLISLTANSGYILCVLAHGEVRQRELRVEGDVRLAVAGGRLEVSAEHGVTIDAGPALSISAQAAALEFDAASVQCDAMTTSGTTSHAVWQETSLTTARRFVAAGRDETHAGESVRSVSGHDQSSVRSAHYRVEQDWTVNAQDASLVAQRRTVIDAGELVNLG